MAETPLAKVEEILRLVWSHLIAANVHLTIWEELRSTPDRQKLCDTYPGFFSWTRDAHVDRFIHKTCVVTDTKKSQPSIYKLANMIQAHPGLAPGSDFRNVLQRLENHAQTRDEIRAVRNRRSSHWDLNKMPPEPNVAKCRELLVELKALLEDLWNAHQPNPTGGRDIYSLIPTEHSHPSYVLDELTTTMLP
jgi:hypothetical protein